MPGGLLSQPEGPLFHQIVDEDRADRDLCADIKKDAQGAEAETGPLQEIEAGKPVRLLVALALETISEREHDESHNPDRNGKSEIALPDGLTFRLAVLNQRVTRQLFGAYDGETAEDED